MNNNVSHHNYNDADFVAEFKNGTLNPNLFNHEAHLRMAWIYATNHSPEQEAELLFQKDLKNYAEGIGAKDKYHKTLTIVAMRLIYRFLNSIEVQPENFEDFITAFPQLKTDFNSLINKHYSFDIFQSEQAKKTFIKPDLLALN